MCITFLTKYSRLVYNLNIIFSSPLSWIFWILPACDTRLYLITFKLLATILGIPLVDHTYMYWLLIIFPSSTIPFVYTRSDEHRTTVRCLHNILGGSEAKDLIRSGELVSGQHRYQI